MRRVLLAQARCERFRGATRTGQTRIGARCGAEVVIKAIKGYEKRRAFSRRAAKSGARVLARKVCQPSSASAGIRAIFNAPAAITTNMLKKNNAHGFLLLIKLLSYRIFAFKEARPPRALPLIIAHNASTRAFAARFVEAFDFVNENGLSLTASKCRRPKKCFFGFSFSKRVRAVRREYSRAFEKSSWHVAGGTKWKSGGEHG